MTRDKTAVKSSVCSGYKGWHFVSCKPLHCMSVCLLLFFCVPKRIFYFFSFFLCSFLASVHNLLTLYTGSEHKEGNTSQRKVRLLGWSEFAFFMHPSYFLVCLFVSSFSSLFFLGFPFMKSSSGFSSYLILCFTFLSETRRQDWRLGWTQDSKRGSELHFES